MLSNIDKAIEELIDNIGKDPLNTDEHHKLSIISDRALSLIYDDFNPTDEDINKVYSDFIHFRIFDINITLVSRKNIDKEMEFSFVYKGEPNTVFVVVDHDNTMDIKSITTALIRILNLVKNNVNFSNKNDSTFGMVLDSSLYVFMASIFIKFTKLFGDNISDEMQLKLLHQIYDEITEAYNKKSMLSVYESPDPNEIVNAIKKNGVKALLDDSEVLMCDFNESIARNIKEKSNDFRDIFGEIFNV